MQIQFIAQGLPEGNSRPAGDAINEALGQSDYKSFAAFVAFASVDGINQLRDSFNNFTDAGGDIRLYIGVDLHGTSKEALDALLAMPNVHTYVVYSPNRIVYHPKIYSFEGERQNMVMVGSSNLTMSGLYQNIEASICITSDKNEEEGCNLLSDIYDYYNTLLTGKSGSCQPLSKELIELLCDNKVVLTVQENRNQRNETSKKNQTGTDDLEKLKGTFATMKTAPAKKGCKRTLIEHVYTEKKRSKPRVYAETVEFNGNSMWVETKKLTGGSRNILDLSKIGVRTIDGEKVKAAGSVEFFGVPKENYAFEKDIELEYDGKVYIGNTIKYAPRNSNWRLQMKGVADDGSKMTYLTSPRLGIPGGMTEKILVFEKTSIPDRYKLHIYEEGLLQQFKEMSKDWACMGRNGRYYGHLK